MVKLGFAEGIWEGKGVKARITTSTKGSLPWRKSLLAETLSEGYVGMWCGYSAVG